MMKILLLVVIFYGEKNPFHDGHNPYVDDNALYIVNNNFSSITYVDNN